jgi:hypothetical protein
MKIQGVVLLLLAQVIVGCTSYEAKEAPAFIFSNSVLRVEQDGLIVGAEPYTDSARLRETFGMDMSRGRYFPIRLRITNQSEQRLVISRDRISLLDQFGVAHPADSSEAVVEDLRHNSVAYGMLGFGIFSFMSAEKANAAMRQDWEAKEISASSFLGKGDVMSGFVFIRLPPETTPQSTTFQLIAVDFISESETLLSAKFSD